jgi:hypothetical protein
LTKCLVFTVLISTAVAFGQNEPAGERYFGGLLDHRSRYGEDWFPEPLRGPEGDSEREIRVDWFHGENQNRQSDEVELELEYNFGLLTFELEVPYERDVESSFDPGAGLTDNSRDEGIGNIEFSVRHPIYQYVSRDERFDFTLVPTLEIAVPSGSKISEDTEFVPGLIGMFRFGEHLSLQTNVGYSFRVGPQEGGESALEYSATLGCNLEREELRIPVVLRTIPLAEVFGERGLSKEESGKNQLFGGVGVRFNLDSIGEAQPRIGFGYIFPIDSGARDELDWGIVTSVIFEF